MAQTTEQSHPKALGLDRLPPDDIMTILLDAQIAAAAAVRPAIPALSEGAAQMAKAIRRGGRIVYAAAGSSGLMGLADGLEITPTFGVPNHRIKILRAGGLADLHIPKGNAEDDVDAALRDGADISTDDCVICLAASGNTPYPVAILNHARGVGAATIGISNNPDSKLLTGSDVPVLLATPPEVIAGSTRLGAGTAQKIALNMMSTMMGVALGHVLDGLMVNVISNNVKLQDRSARIVMKITGCDRDVAMRHLRTTDGQVKLAILLASGAADATVAQAVLDDADQNLRTAIERIS